MAKRPDWSRPCLWCSATPQRDGTQDVDRRPPAHCTPPGWDICAKETWGYVANRLDEAARSGDVLDVVVPLRFVSMLEGIECQ